MSSNFCFVFVCGNIVNSLRFTAFLVPLVLIRLDDWVTRPSKVLWFIEFEFDEEAESVPILKVSSMVNPPLKVLINWNGSAHFDRKPKSELDDELAICESSIRIGWIRMLHTNSMKSSWLILITLRFEMIHDWLGSWAQYTNTENCEDSQQRDERAEESSGKETSTRNTILPDELLRRETTSFLCDDTDKTNANRNNTGTNRNRSSSSSSRSRSGSSDGSLGVRGQVEFVGFFRLVFSSSFSVFSFRVRVWVCSLIVQQLHWLRCFTSISLSLLSQLAHAFRAELQISALIPLHIWGLASSWEGERGNQYNGKPSFILSQGDMLQNSIERKYRKRKRGEKDKNQL